MITLAIGSGVIAAGILLAVVILAVVAVVALAISANWDEFSEWAAVVMLVAVLWGAFLFSRWLGIGLVVAFVSFAVSEFRRGRSG